MSTEVKAKVGTFVWHEHVSTNPEAAQEFYGQLLGWEFPVMSPAGEDYTLISSGGQMHGGFPPVPAGTPSHWVGNVQVESADAAVEQAAAGGGKVLVEPMDIPEIGRYAAVMDPQGAVIAAFQPAGDDQLGTGVFVWDELMTSDIEAAKRFYGDVFGWSAADMAMGADFTYTMFKRTGGEDVAGAMALGEIPAPPHWLPYLAADDIDATAARAGELGGTVMREPWQIEGVGRLAIVSDPAGAVFGLFKPRM